MCRRRTPFWPLHHLPIRAALHMGVAGRLDGTVQAFGGCLAGFLGRTWGVREDFLEEVMAKA